MQKAEEMANAKKRKVTDLSGKTLQEIKISEDILDSTTIILDDNRVSDLTQLSRILHLEKLSVARNHLLQMETVEVLSRIRVLDLRENDIEFIAGLSNLVHLEWLCLSGNMIKDVKNLKKNVLLNYLDLSDNLITEFGDMSCLVHLKTLLFDGNKVNNLKNVPRCLPPSLLTLTMAENHLTDLTEVQLLSNLPFLEELVIYGNPFTVDEDGQYVDYRPYVICCCKNLVKIDTSAISQADRHNAKIIEAEGHLRMLQPGQHNQLAKQLLEASPGYSPQFSRRRRVIQDQTEDPKKGTGLDSSLLESESVHLPLIYDSPPKSKQRPTEETRPSTAPTLAAFDSLSWKSLMSTDHKLSKSANLNDQGMQPLKSEFSPEYSFESDGRPDNIEYAARTTNRKYRAKVRIEEVAESTPTESSSDQETVVERRSENGAVEVENYGERDRDGDHFDALQSSVPLTADEAARLLHLAAAMIQAFVRGFLQRRRYQRFLQKHKAAIKIQAVWRGYHARNLNIKIIHIRNKLQARKFQSQMLSLEKRMKRMEVERKKEKTIVCDALRIFLQEMNVCREKIDKVEKAKEREELFKNELHGICVGLQSEICHLRSAMEDRMHPDVAIWDSLGRDMQEDNEDRDNRRRGAQSNRNRDASNKTESPDVAVSCKENVNNVELTSLSKRENDKDAVEGVKKGEIVLPFVKKERRNPEELETQKGLQNEILTRVDNECVAHLQTAQQLLVKEVAVGGFGSSVTTRDRLPWTRKTCQMKNTDRVKMFDDVTHSKESDTRYVQEKTEQKAGSNKEAFEVTNTKLNETFDLAESRDPPTSMHVEKTNESCSLNEPDCEVTNETIGSSVFVNEPRDDYANSILGEGLSTSVDDVTIREIGVGEYGETSSKRGVGEASIDYEKSTNEEYNIPVIVPNIEMAAATNGAKLESADAVKNFGNFEVISTVIKASKRQDTLPQSTDSITSIEQSALITGEKGEENIEAVISSASSNNDKSDARLMTSQNVPLDGAKSSRLADTIRFIEDAPFNCEQQMTSTDATVSYKVIDSIANSGDYLPKLEKQEAAAKRRRTLFPSIIPSDKGTGNIGHSSRLNRSTSSATSNRLFSPVIKSSMSEDSTTSPGEIAALAYVKSMYKKDDNHRQKSEFRETGIRSVYKEVAEVHGTLLPKTDQHNVGAEILEKRDITPASKNDEGSKFLGKDEIGKRHANFEDRASSETKEMVKKPLKVDAAESQKEEIDLDIGKAKVIGILSKESQAGEPLHCVDDTVASVDDSVLRHIRTSTPVKQTPECSYEQVNDQHDKTAEGKITMGLSDVPECLQSMPKIIPMTQTEGKSPGLPYFEDKSSDEGDDSLLA